MIKNLLKKYWADPVWSKVIAVGILALISFLWISFKSMMSKISLKETFFKVLSTSIQVKYLVIVILFAFFVWIIIRLFITNKKIIEEYSEEHKNLDKELLIKIKTEIFPINGSIDFILTNNFAGSFLNENIKDLDKVCYYIDKPDFEFIDRDLNNYLEQLKIKIDKFESIINLNTWPVSNSNVNANTVPPEWEIEHHERFWKVVTEIHSTTREICKNYDELIKIGKRKIGV